MCPDPKCHWDDWHHGFVVYWPPPVGYRPCPRDHGEAGDLERLIRGTIYASMGGPIGGVQKLVEALMKRQGGEVQGSN